MPEKFCLKIFFAKYLTEHPSFEEKIFVNLILEKGHMYFR